MPNSHRVIATLAVFVLSALGLALIFALPSGSSLAGPGSGWPGQLTRKVPQAQASITLPYTVTVTPTLTATGTPTVTPTETSIPTVTPTPSGTPSPTPSVFFQYLPLKLGVSPPEIEFLDAWTSDSLGVRRTAFLPEADITFVAAGRNNLSVPLTVTLQVDQEGPCGPSLVFSDTLVLPSGDWEIGLPDLTQACAGLYVADTMILYPTEHAGILTSTRSADFVVNEPSVVVQSQAQGFDKCHIPSVENMGLWWDESPYSVFNLYLGGNSFFCDEQPLDADWVHRVAGQGWTFILTWVGPQAPCTGFIHKMSWDPALAYNEGKIEAALAAYAADHLGLMSDRVIYYDMEGYTNASSACRAAVQSFIQGWTEQLHDFGLKAGGYGGACSSYLADWSLNNPAPDDVWIAHWTSSSYDPDATVWDAPCLSNALWADHQRIKQYAGGHVESWGGLSISIDSNVLDGEITALPGFAAPASTIASSVAVQVFGPRIHDLGLVAPERGWTLAEDGLLLTSNGGATWQDVTPQGLRVHEAAFVNLQTGWAVGRTMDGRLATARTEDGGFHWETRPIEDPGATEIPGEGRATIEVLDDETAWVALQLPTSANFSQGELFFTRDGGRTWDRRNLTLGERVSFVDELRGWTAGGPAGDRLYHTLDGGRTWRETPLESLAGTVSVGTPHFSTGDTGWLRVATDGPEGRRFSVYRTTDGGGTWILESERPASRPRESLEAWTALDGTVPAIDLPAGTVRASFADDSYGWVAVQRGRCEGKDRLSGGESAVTEAAQCVQEWSLLATEDGGRSWREITP